MSTSPKSMSQVSSVDGQSPRGLINGAEFMKSLKHSTAWGVAVSTAVAVVIALLSDIDKWYQGFGKEFLVMIAGYAVLFLRAQMIGKSYLEKGGD